MPKIKTVRGTETRKLVSREEWLAARLALLKQEKELTRRSDELARQRQELSWVRIGKEEGFETDDGKARGTELYASEH